MTSPDDITSRSTPDPADPDVYTDGKHRWRKIFTGAQVTKGVLALAENVEEDWFSDKEKIRWPEFWDKLEGSFLPDGTRIDLGNEFNTLAMKKIKKHINQYRQYGG
jgi:hypothetical protein